jgi:hypothetical protein
MLGQITVEQTAYWGELATVKCCAAVLRPCARKMMSRGRFRWSEAVRAGSTDAKGRGEHGGALNLAWDGSAAAACSSGSRMLDGGDKKKRNDGRLWL